MRVNQQAAFVLLNRPYSETSWIVELFTKEHGRLAVMAKGARRIKSRLKGVLLPFQPLLVSWSGKGEIPTLTAAEIDLQRFNIVDHQLSGDRSVCGFYCNELIVNLLHRHDPHPILFERYLSTIIELSTCELNNLANVLREFEQVLIKETGYEINFKQQADGRTEIDHQAHYRFQRDEGFIPCDARQNDAISGRIIRALGNTSESIQPPLSAEEMSQGKHLMRDILNQTLGYKPVISRELFFPRERGGNDVANSPERKTALSPSEQTCER